ncbi:uncharacterized protein VP01_858g2 [Puccinia sorghi]|uniref:DDE Tnp4 domain-containing protein n=1 Tax=Puccinia sorghi TaxID=27349 RepID=A0A0L6U8X9_9BASI|nr:uncharacterized protein VP01_858g2 [Puccinia sorghi]
MRRSPCKSPHKLNFALYKSHDAALGRICFPTAAARLATPKWQSDVDGNREMTPKMETNISSNNSSQATLFFTITPTVPAFKRKKNHVLSYDEHGFNRHLSGVQVVIEDCIGMLKNIFQSLKGQFL